jgi:hypothetical protein
MSRIFQPPARFAIAGCWPTFEDLFEFDECIGDLASIDVIFGAQHVRFANDLSTAKLPESM